MQANGSCVAKDYRLKPQRWIKIILAGFVDNPNHAITGVFFHKFIPLTPKLAGKAIVSVQGPLVLSDGTELYPDLAVLQRRDDGYRRSNPTADDVLLVIEVADTSLVLDQGVKLARYAGAGIRRYWIVDLRHRTLHDYRDPDRFQRRYRQLHSLISGVLDLDIAGVPISLSLAEVFPD